MRRIEGILAPGKAVATALLLGSTPLWGQSPPPRHELSIGGFVGWRPGAQARVNLPVPLGRHLLVTHSLELGAMWSWGPCELNDFACEQRPGTEVIGGTSLTLGIQGASRTRPHLEVGAALVHRFPELLDEERRTFLAPVMEAGLRPNAPWGRWSAAIRWRWIKYSRVESGSWELGLFVGIIPGRSARGPTSTPAARGGL